MFRHALLALSGSALLLVAAAAAAADVYQWKDANGVTHYSQTPPPSGAYSEHSESGRYYQARPAQPTAAAPAESPQCATARKNLIVLQGKAEVQIDSNGDGKPDKTLDADGRANQLALAQAQIKADCTASAGSTGK